MLKQDKILILGSTGLLGSSLVPHLRQGGHNIVTHARTEGTAEFIGDLEGRSVTHELLTIVQPSIIINLVGLTSVEICQEQPHKAYQVNTQTVENIACWIKQSNTSCHLIHISTDQVYDGDGPHDEENITLTNNYALTKYAGEIAAIAVKCTILRTNFVGRSKVNSRESLTDWVYTNLIASRKVEVLTDILFSPLSLTTMVEMIELVIRHKPPGVYNMGSSEGMSKADFDFEFASRLGLPVNSMSRIKTSEAAFLHAYRPKDMRMNCSKFEKKLGIRLPNLSDEIEKSAEDYNEKN
ncbi:SDR family oxidoreductase [Oceanospirillaceae bacterium]|nr:SDR family oxidoreductase [Oceanospirillaceae bacterium]